MLERPLLKTNITNVRRGMKTKSVAMGFAMLLASLLAFSKPILAHHGYAAYDMQVIRQMKGTITSFMIMNPHTQMNIDIKDDKGNVESWVVEAIFGPRGMKDGGWEFDSLKPGDEVTIYYHPVKGAAHAALFIKVVFPDGRVLPKTANQ
jgi:hypothetical protein